MAENTNTSTTTLDQQLIQQQQANSFKRKFQKLKTKFFELFFATNSTITSNSKTVSDKVASHNNKIEKSISTNTLNSSMLISNCYYGYKSSLIETSFDENHNHSNSTTNNNNNNINNTVRRMSKNVNTLSSSSLNSPLTSQDTASTQKKLVSSMSSASSSISSIVTHQDKQSASLTSDNFSRLDQTGIYDSYNHEFTDSIIENNTNPFLNKKLTDSIQINSDINQLIGYFEAYLNLIDDQDNFFNINFMINYISYILLRNLNECDLKSVLKECDDSSNLIKEIAKQIYVESENEPCGLKGCKLSIYLETETEDETCLLTQFRFDSTCLLTTFELNLTLKQDTKSGVDNQSSSLTNLTKRLLSNKSKQNKKKSENAIYLDSINFDLFKRKLY